MQNFAQTQLETEEITGKWFFKHTIASFIFWVSFYLATHFLIPYKGSKLKGADLRTRIVGICHGLFSFLISSYYVFTVGIDFEIGIDWFNSRIITFSLGYFFYDLSVCYYLGLGDIKLLQHHLCCFITFGYIMFSGQGVFMGICGLAVAESSNCPLNLRGILKLYDLRFTKIYELLEVFYFVIYILTRGFIGPVLFLLGLFSPSTPHLVKLAVFGIILQSSFFIKDMLFIFKRKYNEYQERVEKGIGLYWFSHNPESFNLDYIKSRKPDTGF